MLGALEALGCFSGFSKVKSVLAIQLWKGWFSTQVIFACSWFALDVSGLLLCSAPSQAGFNNNTSIFLGTSGPGPQQSSGHRGTWGFYSHTPSGGSFLPKPHSPHPKGAGSDELSGADLPPLPVCCLLESADSTTMPKFTGNPQAKPPCHGSRAL